jgi:hypothetical protein
MSADEPPDPGLPQDPGIPGERAPCELPPEPVRAPLPGEDPGAVPEDPDQEGHRIVRRSRGDRPLSARSPLGRAPPLGVPQPRFFRAALRSETHRSPI